MPYSSIEDLPKGVEGLPKHAKEIYKSAFNVAYEKYKDDARASKIAWSAVKQKYKKVGEDWQAKSGAASGFIYSDKFEFKSEGPDGNKDYFVKFYLSTSMPDKVNDIVTKHCQIDMCQQVKASRDIHAITLKGNDDHEQILYDRNLLSRAMIVDADVDDAGLYAVAKMNKYHPEFENYWGSISEKFIDAVSMEYIPEVWTTEIHEGKSYRVLDKVKLCGMAFTGRPVNEDCNIIDFCIKSLAIKQTEENELEDKKLNENKDAAIEAKSETPKVSNEKVNAEETKSTSEVASLKKELEDMKSRESVRTKELEDMKSMIRDKFIEDIKAQVKAELKSLQPEMKNLVELNQVPNFATKEMDVTKMTMGDMICIKHGGKIDGRL